MSLQKQKLNWIEPLDLAQKIADNYSAESWIFLYSSLSSEIKNSRSIIALFPQKELILDNLAQLQNALNPHKSWLGYISYEAYKDKSATEKSFINLPKIWLLNFSLILEFDHDKKTLEAHFSKQEQLAEVLNYQTTFVEEKSKIKNYIPNFSTENNAPNFSDKNIQITNFVSNFSDDEYLREVEDIKNMIQCGDFYQANLTRKFFGNINIEKQKDFFSLFLELDKTSPANYSSFIKLRDNFIISSSPELFLSIKNGEIISRPIKGTAPRSNDLKQDQENKKNLQNSDKERAENLMIVDLVRNDLSKVCKAGSVMVKNLFHITSYKTLHHMSSEISGKISNEFNIIDAVQSCFPAGSMTGAPKIKAMEIIAQKEKINRGIYSGALGYFKGDEVNLSVVIRTLICQKNKFEFQVGGAITFDSVARTELEETEIKAQAIKKVLGIL
ncbi:MAG: anthranilate synthase component I family protein [Rickettsiales bacterium]|nr:anthranilate synthase component I family protein [Rickettsiales bacterium]